MIPRPEVRPLRGHALVCLSGERTEHRPAEDI
jgi:hypothetical protein